MFHQFKASILYPKIDEDRERHLEHHKKQTFKEEYLEFLKHFKIEHDEKYIFQELLRYLSSLRLSVVSLFLLNGLKSVVTKRVNPTALLRAIKSFRINQYFKEKIFQPFFTLIPTCQGKGLCLSLSYGIVKAHGGELKVKSEEGEGSEFTVSLPSI